MGSNIEIGPYTNFGNLKVTHVDTCLYCIGKLILSREGKLTVGKFCNLSNVIIYLGGEHNYKWVSSYNPFDVMELSKFPDKEGEQPSLAKRCYKNGYFDTSVHIGNDVWFGDDCKVLAGITIGDGAVIGSSSVVTKDVPPYAIVAGDPIKLIKYRFTKEQIGSLLKIKWWDWDIEKIKRFASLIFSSNIDLFIKKALE